MAPGGLTDTVRVVRPGFNSSCMNSYSLGFCFFALFVAVDDSCACGWDHGGWWVSSGSCVGLILILQPVGEIRSGWDHEVCGGIWLNGPHHLLIFSQFFSPRRTANMHQIPGTWVVGLSRKGQDSEQYVPLSPET